MKKLDILLKTLKDNKQNLKEQYKVKAIGIFGSYANGKPSPDSDIDILVDFMAPPDFFQFLRLEATLKKLLGKKVDLVTRKALKPFIKKDILDDTVFA